MDRPVRPDYVPEGAVCLTPDQIRCLALGPWAMGFDTMLSTDDARAADVEGLWILQDMDGWVMVGNYGGRDSETSGIYLTPAGSAVYGPPLPTDADWDLGEWVEVQVLEETKRSITVRVREIPPGERLSRDDA